LATKVGIHLNDLKKRTKTSLQELAGSGGHSKDAKTTAEPRGSMGGSTMISTTSTTFSSSRSSRSVTNTGNDIDGGSTSSKNISTSGMSVDTSKDCNCGAKQGSRKRQRSQDVQGVGIDIYDIYDDEASSASESEQSDSHLEEESEVALRQRWCETIDALLQKWKRTIKTELSKEKQQSKYGPVLFHFGNTVRNKTCRAFYNRLKKNDGTNDEKAKELAKAIEKILINQYQEPSHFYSHHARNLALAMSEHPSLLHSLKADETSPHEFISEVYRLNNLPKHQR